MAAYPSCQSLYTLFLGDDFPPAKLSFLKNHKRHLHKYIESLLLYKEYGLLSNSVNGTADTMYHISVNILTISSYLWRFHVIKTQQSERIHWSSDKMCLAHRQNRRVAMASVQMDTQFSNWKVWWSSISTRHTMNSARQWQAFTLAKAKKEKVKVPKRKSTLHTCTLTHTPILSVCVYYACYRIMRFVRHFRGMSLILKLNALAMLLPTPPPLPTWASSAYSCSCIEQAVSVKNVRGNFNATHTRTGASSHNPPTLVDFE